MGRLVPDVAARGNEILGQESTYRKTLREGKPVPDDLGARRFRSHIRPRTVALWILFAGLAVSLVANIRLERKTAGLLTDMANLRQDTQAQIAELRQAQSASLEQDLLRLDELTTQLQKSDQDEQHETLSLTNKLRAELARTVEQRHQEMITAVSDLRADLRAASGIKKPQANDVQRTSPGDGSHSNVTVHLASVTGDTPAGDVTKTLISDAVPPAGPPPAPHAKKKKFWSKLNPFSRSKNDKNPDSGQSDPAQ